MSLQFVLASITTTSGERKLVAFRDVASATHAEVVYPESYLNIEYNYMLLTSPEVWKALDRLLKGSDGFEYLSLDYGVKSPKEIHEAYSA